MSATVTVTILSIISAAIRFAGQLVGLRTRPSAKQLAEKAAHDARAASAQGAATAVNAAIERERIRKGLVVPLLAAMLLTAGCGCSLLRPTSPPAPADLPPAVVVISADRYQYPMTNDAGVVGWFVPIAVHAEMMEAVALVDYYRSQNRFKPPKKGPSK